MHRYFAFILIFIVSVAANAQPLQWKRTVINAKSKFEAAGVADFNKDGVLDIMCGDTWYEGPTWKPHHVCDIAEKDGYRVDFANIPMDVNGDGWIDIVSCNWHEQSVVWRENPGKGDKPWTEHLVDKPGNSETAIAADIDGDGVLDFLPDVAQKTVWYRLENGKLVPHEISAKIGGHGIGFGDVNGDGRKDILKPGGWFEAPEDRIHGTWIWHPEWNLGGAGEEIIAHDFTGDGKPDIFWGMGHDYGTFWLEQTADSDPAKKWIQHQVDKDWSQAHALRPADFNGNGTFQILAGKRKYAHTTDPGAEDKMCIYIYTPLTISAIDGGQEWKKTTVFTRQIVHEGDGDGLGLGPVVIDIDGDGDLDIVAPGKSGLYLYQQEKKIGPTEPEKARSEIRVPDGFEVTLFASEPQIRKPIAMAFDERGRMIVAEAAEYPLGPPKGQPPNDSVKILEDTNGDGRADKVTVFADGLNIPDGVAAYNGGVIIAEAPNLWLMRDTDGDGKADEKKAVLTNFGRQDTHHMVHGLVWGPEGKLMMSQGCSTNSRITADGKEWFLDHGDFFRCWPDGSGFEIPFRSFTNSWGYDWDDYGNWFGNDNEGPRLIHLVEEGDYGLALTDRRAGKPGTLPGLATDGTHNHGYVVQAGLTIYSGDAFPKEYRGNVFEGAPNYHSILRDSLEPSGATFFATEEDDLTKTDDLWHRPIALTVGPDGAIYMIDWYNEILAHVEHPLDSPRRDKTRGRIYRIAWKGAPKFHPPDLMKASASELVANLRSENRWIRRTSQRLLATKGEEAFRLVLPLLDEKESPRTRCHALWTIEESRLAEKPDGKAKVIEAVQRAFNDHDSRARAVAVRTARHLDLEGKDVAEKLLELSGDPDDFVKFEAALALSKLKSPLPLKDLTGLIARAQWEDPFLSYAFGEAVRPNQEQLVTHAFTVGAQGLAREEDGYVAALLRIRDPRTEPIFVALLQQPDLRPSMTEELIGGLYAFKTPETSRALVRFLAERPELPAPLARPILSDLRRRPIGKNESPSDDIKQVLAKLAERGDPALLRDVLLTAARLHDRELEPQITKSLESRDPKIADAAVLACGELGLANTAPAIMQFANAGDAERKWRAVRTLASIGEDRASADLFLANIENPDSTGDAIHGLKRLAGKPENKTLLVKTMEKISTENIAIRGKMRKDLEDWIKKDAAPDDAKKNMQTLAAGEGVIRDWLVIGPFPNPDSKGHSTAYPPESDLRTDAEYTYYEQALKWKKVRVDDADGIVNLMDLKPNENVVAYGWATVESPVDRTATLFAGSDDSIKIWLNGKLVLDHLVDRGLAVDQEQVPINLQKGTNTILLKCGQNHGGWNFHARIETLPRALEKYSTDLEMRTFYSRGNAARGKEVFFRGAAGCARCHAIGDEGGRVGPDLSEVGRLHPRSYILRSILKPSEEIAEGYSGVSLETAKGPLEGYINRETPTEIQFVTSEGKTLLIQKKDVKNRRQRATSGMPEELEKALNPRELADLVAYLEDQR